MLIELHDRNDLEQLLQRSHREPVLLFKHSTQCGRSAGVMEEVTAFMLENNQVPVGLTLVLEHRDLSDDIEDRFGIQHESPQAFIVVNGAPVWHASHWKITARTLSHELGKFSTPCQIV